MESEYPTPGMLFIPKTDDLLETWVVISTRVHVVDGVQKYTICWLSARQELFVGLPQRWAAATYRSCVNSVHEGAL